MRSEFEEFFRTTEKYRNYKRFWRDDQIFRFEDVSFVDSVIQSYYETYQHQQSKVDELQKRVVAALEVIKPLLVCEMYAHEAVKLEQALKGELNESD